MAFIASARGAEVPCSVGDCSDVAIGVFRCNGCLHNFCSKHSIEHRRGLGDRLGELLRREHSMSEYAKDLKERSRHHPLLDEIDRWETAAIEKVRKAAEEARLEVLRFNIRDLETIENILRRINGEMNDRLQSDNFLEGHLTEWRTNLDQLKNSLNTKPPPIALREDRSSPLVSRISVELSRYIGPCDPSHGDTRLSRYMGPHDTPRGDPRSQGFVVMSMHGTDNTHGLIKNQLEYSSGSHRFRIKIQRMYNKWIFFGIVSSKDPSKTKIHDSYSLHGWNGQYQVVPSGKKIRNISSCDYGWEQDDIADLVLDCDTETIQLTNDRTETTREIAVNMKHCPLPWSPFVSLLNNHDPVNLMLA